MLQLGELGACAEVYRMEGRSLDASFRTLRTGKGFRPGQYMQSASGYTRAGGSGTCSHEGYGNE